MASARLKTVWSLAGMLACLAAAETGLRWSGLADRLSDEDMFASRLEYFRAQEPAPQVVALGNSRVRHGIDTAVLNESLTSALGHRVSSWNLGMGGLTGHSFLPWAGRVLEREPLAEVVVIGLSPTDFVSTTPPALEHLVMARPWRASDLPSAFAAGASMEQALTILANSASLGLSFRARIQELVSGGRPLGPKLGPDRAGFKSEAPVPARLQKTRAQHRSQGYRRELVGPDKRLGLFKLGCLDQAVGQLRAADVQVLLVAMPASSAVGGLAREPDSLVPTILAEIAALAQRHAVGFVDWSRPDWLTDAHFTDGDHLNRNGARLLTGHLVSEWILPEVYAKAAPGKQD